jgi:hypothetical protein
MKVKNNPQVYMEPGKYYVGDLCYVLDDSWKEFCEITIDGYDVLHGGFRFKDGREFVTFGTAYGDGEYKDEQGRRYPVDAGLIGCVRVEDMDCEIDEVCDSGNIITFDRPFVCERVGTIIYFGKVAIETGDTDDDEYDDEEDEYFDDEEEESE